jgi:RNA polymerase sigma factor (sigma-70 family)
MGDAAVLLTELVWGDQAAFERRHDEMTRVFDDVYARMEKYFRKNAEDPFVADLTQKAGEKVWALWIRQFIEWEWAPPPEPVRFAKRVARNLLLDHRASQKASVKLIDHKVDVGDVDVPIEERRPGDAGDEEFQKRVDDTVAAMPEKMGQVWTLRAGGAEYDEIAAELGIEESTARRHIHDATKRLQASLQPYLEGRR